MTVPTLESLFVATFALFGLRLGLRPLADNSLFWHLRTGIDIVRSGHVPRTDPYSFTAGGEPWVVQSWLAEASYGVAERLGGLTAVQLEFGALYCVLGWLIGALARTGVGWRTAFAASLATGLGAGQWAPRPLAFGLVALAVTVLVVERRRSPWWLVPVAWLWVNTHGSFVLGAAWLALVVVGEWLDHRDAGTRPPSVRWLGTFALGLGAAVVNPLGPRLLAFPFALLSHREAFERVVEWQPPSFRSGPEMLALLCLLVIVVAAARARTRLGWADLLPLVALLGAGLLARRNLPIAAVVAAPVLARALRPLSEEPASGSADVPDRPSIHLGLAGLLAVVGAMFVATAVVGPPVDLGGYPVVAARMLPVGAHVATTDVAAGYLILARRDVRVFFDDRVDFYPARITADYIRLLDGRPDSVRLLDRYDVDAILWPADGALNGQLAGSEGWRRVGVRDGWVVYLRT